MPPLIDLAGGNGFLALRARFLVRAALSAWLPVKDYHRRQPGNAARLASFGRLTASKRVLGADKISVAKWNGQI